MLMYIFLGLLVISRLRAESKYKAEIRLEEMLFKSYRNEIRPVLHHKDNVTITVGISLNNIKKMDDKNQILTLSTWIRQKWYDPRLGWNPSNFASTKTIHVSASKLWVPDLKVYNEVNRKVNSGLDQIPTKCVINASGDVLWMAPYVLQLSCQVDIKYFPYDTQICKVKIGSWTYDGFAVDVKPESYTMDVSKSPSNPEWELVSTQVKRNVQIYPCCPEPYPDVTYRITIKRRVQNYWINFFFPGIFLTVMTMMAFASPASDTGERFGLILTSLVSMFVFLKMIAEKTPSSDTIPLLSINFVMLGFEIGLIFYSVCLSINAYHRNPSMGEMPGYIRTVVLEKLGGWWGLREEGHAIIRKLEALENVALMKDRVTARLEALKTALRSPETSPSNRPKNLCKSIAICSTRKPEDPAVVVVLKPPANRNSDADVPEEKPSSTSAPSTSNVTHQGINSPSDFSHKSAKTSKKRSAAEQKKMKTSHSHGSSCSCPSLLQEMVMINKRLLSSIREIIYVARQYDKTSSEKERWLLVAAILDRAFLVLFVLSFIVVTLVLLLW